MKGLVIAAGYATRLYPLTLDRPKALLEVGGRPMLDYILERLEAMGVDETIVVTNAKFTPHFEEWSKDMERVRIVNDGTTSNDDRLGAIGDIGFVLDELDLDDDLVVVAGDNLFGGDISGFPAYGRKVNAPVLAVHDVGDLEQMKEYNQVEIDDDGRVVFMEEKPALLLPARHPAAHPPVPRRREQPRPAWAPAGVAVPAYARLYVADPGRLVRHRLGGDPARSRSDLFTET